MSGFYSRRAWHKQARLQALHNAGYRCQHCGCNLLELEPRLRHVHHRKELRRAPALGLEPQNLQALCAGCHNMVEPRDGKQHVAKGCNIDGTPIDPRHPWNIAPQ